MLMGNKNMSETEKKEMMANIQKIVDKPIIIEQRKESSSSEYEEKADRDYI